MLEYPSSAAISLPRKAWGFQSAVVAVFAFALDTPKQTDVTSIRVAYSDETVANRDAKVWTAKQKMALER